MGEVEVGARQLRIGVRHAVLVVLRRAAPELDLEPQPLRERVDVALVAVARELVPRTHVRCPAQVCDLVREGVPVPVELRDVELAAPCEPGVAREVDLLDDALAGKPLRHVDRIADERVSAHVPEVEAALYRRDGDGRGDLPAADVPGRERAREEVVERRGADHAGLPCGDARESCRPVWDAEAQTERARGLARECLGREGAFASRRRRDHLPAASLRCADETLELFRRQLHLVWHVARIAHVPLERETRGGLRSAGDGCRGDGCACGRSLQ